MRRLPGDAKDNGRLIKTAREEAGLSVKELAQKAGLSENTIRNAERGDDNPTIKSLRRIELVTGSIRSRGHNERLEFLWTFSQLRAYDENKIKTELHMACTNNGGWIPHEYLPLSNTGADTALAHYKQTNYRSTLEKQEAHLLNISTIIANTIRKKRIHIICLTCGHGWIDLNFIRRLVDLNEQRVVVEVIHPSHALLERGIQHAIAMFSGIDHVSLKFYVGDFESIFPMIVHQYDIGEYRRIVCILGPLDNLTEMSN